MLKIYSNDDNQSKDRNCYIDLLRFIMSIYVLIYHYNFYVLHFSSQYLIPCGYRCVDAFFVLSGYYTFCKAEKLKKKTIQQFVKGKLFRLYPTYIICYILYFLLVAIKGELPIIETKFAGLRYSWIVTDLLMMQNWGIGLPTLGDWYISALLLGMIVVFLVNKHCNIVWEKVLYFVFVVVFSVGILLLHGNLHVNGERFHISAGVVRAIIGLTVGAIASKYKPDIYKPKHFYLLGNLVMLVFMVIAKDTIMDFLIYPITVVVLWSGTSMGYHGSEKTRFIINYVGKISFEIYLIHTFVREGLLWCSPILGSNIIVNIICSLIFAMCIHFVVCSLTRKIGRKTKPS